MRRTLCEVAFGIHIKIKSEHIVNLIINKSIKFRVLNWNWKTTKKQIWYDFIKDSTLFCFENQYRQSNLQRCMFFLYSLLEMSKVVCRLQYFRPEHPNAKRFFAVLQILTEAKRRKELWGWRSRKKHYKNVRNPYRKDEERCVEKLLSDARFSFSLAKKTGLAQWTSVKSKPKMANTFCLKPSFSAH